MSSNSATVNPYMGSVAECKGFPLKGDGMIRAYLSQLNLHLVYDWYTFSFTLPYGTKKILL